MLRFRKIFIGLAVICMAIVLNDRAAAQSQKTDIRPHANLMMGDELLMAFEGVTHEGAYNFTDAGDPRRFYTETTHAMGRTSYSEKGLEAEGDWSVKNNTLCFRYDSADMTGGCFRVYRVGNCYYYYSDSLLMRRDELDRDYWTARSVRAGEAPSCEPGVS